jgi:carbon-monoxide dehydrogenase medium subunit
MKPAPFDYVVAESVEDVAARLADDEDARILAGGQSLVPMLNLRLAVPSRVIDISRLAELGVIERDGDELVIGAMVRQSRAHASSEVRSLCPLIAETLIHVGHPQTRSRGTVGGSIAHADPAAELPAVLLALDGAVDVHGPSGTRTIAARDLYLGYYTTSLEPGELITRVRFPVAPERSGAGCWELSRRKRDFALAGAVVQVTLEPDGAVADARVALFGVGDRPERAEAVESALRGALPTAESIGTAADAWEPPSGAGEELMPYSARIAPVMARRALMQAIDGIS